MKNSLLDSIANKQQFGTKILNEIKPFFPQINGCLYAESLLFSDTLKSNHTFPMVVILSNTKIQDAERKKINNWLKKKTKNYNTKIFYE